MVEGVIEIGVGLKVKWEDVGMERVRWVEWAIETGVALKVKWEYAGMGRVRRVVELKMGMAKVAKGNFEGTRIWRNLKVLMTLSRTRYCSFYAV